MASSTHPPSLDVPFTVRDRRRKGFFTIDNALLDQYGAQLKAHGLAVYLALARFVNQDGTCWPSLSTIANRTGMSRMQVIREITKLQELRLIAIEHQYGEKGEPRANLYILLNLPEVVTDSNWELPKQYTENKTQLQNKTQRTTQASHAPINNNNGGQLAQPPVVVASSDSSTQKSGSAEPTRNTKGKEAPPSRPCRKPPSPLIPLPPR